MINQNVEVRVWIVCCFKSGHGARGKTLNFSPALAVGFEASSKIKDAFLFMVGAS